jgi:predicted amidophosphoribosyltransferase
MPDPQPVASPPTVCPLCGAPVAPTDERCPECNMTLAGIGGRPDAFTRGSVWRWAAALLAIYVVALLIVLAVR